MPLHLLSSATCRTLGPSCDRKAGSAAIPNRQRSQRAATLTNINMKTLPYGHPDTLRTGPHRCNGSIGLGQKPSTTYTPRQRAWMQENKPLYYSGEIKNDISHLPAHLRHDG